MLQRRNLKGREKILNNGKVYLLGASGHGKVVHNILNLCAVEIGGFYDKDNSIKQFLNCPVLTEDKIEKNDRLIITVGDNSTRKHISQKFRDNMFAQAIHPRSILSNDITVGQGTVVMAGSVINPGVGVGDHAIINTSANIDHDCIIDDFVHISPGATLAGSVKVGEGTHIGTNATILPNLTIGKWATIGAGTVILEDVSDYAVVVGNPGRVVKYNNTDD